MSLAMSRVHPTQTRRSFSGLVLGLMSVCVLATGAPAQAVETSEARVLVVETLERVLEILGNDGLSENDKRRRIEALAFSHFDFDTMSRLVLARNWKKFSAEERTQFVGEYKTLLSRSYGVRLNRFGDEEIEVTGEQAEPRGDVTIRTQIIGGEFDGAQIDYRMRSRDGNWKAIDVVIEGVSLVSNYRSQFGEVVSRKGPAGLIKQMRKKNAAPAEAEQAG